jgi:uridine kinase
MTNVTSEWKRLARRLEARDNAVISKPLAHIVRELDLRVVGIGGPAGSGKSTIAELMADELGEVLVMSLDDFYLSRDERSSRGLRWRGPPGSHDLAALLDVLDGIRERRVPIDIPKFSAEIDDRVEPITITRAPNYVLLEGWLLGHRGDGYDAILDRLDLMTFLDVDDETTRTRRFDREAALREHGGGFSKQEMQSFWDEVLGPGIPRWVRSAKESADLVFEMPLGNLRSVHTTSSMVLAGLTHPG